MSEGKSQTVTELLVALNARDVDGYLASLHRRRGTGPGYGDARRGIPGTSWDRAFLSLTSGTRPICRSRPSSSRPSARAWLPSSEPAPVGGPASSEANLSLRRSTRSWARRSGASASSSTASKPSKPRGCGSRVLRASRPRAQGNRSLESARRRPVAQLCRAADRVDTRRSRGGRPRRLSRARGGGQRVCSGVADLGRLSL